MDRLNANDFLAKIRLDVDSPVPKYKQLVQAVSAAVHSGSIQAGWPLPSLHELSVSLNLARKTVEKAYGRLKHLGVVCSVRGKGHFVASQVGKNNRILLILGPDSVGRPVELRAVLEGFNEDVQVDIFLDNGNGNLLMEMIMGRQRSYDSFIVVGSGMTATCRPEDVLEMGNYSDRQECNIF